MDRELVMGEILGTEKPVRVLDMVSKLVALGGSDGSEADAMYLGRRIRSCLYHLHRKERLVRPIKIPESKHLGWVRFDSAYPRDLVLEGTRKTS
jgi:hypothetical protein